MQNRHVGFHCLKRDVLGGNIRRVQGSVDLVTLESSWRHIIACLMHCVDAVSLLVSFSVSFLLGPSQTSYWGEMTNVVVSLSFAENSGKFWSDLRWESILSLGTLLIVYSFVITWFIGCQWLFSFPLCWQLFVLNRTFAASVLVVGAGTGEEVWGEHGGINVMANPPDEAWQRAAQGRKHTASGGQPGIDGQAIWFVS